MPGYTNVPKPSGTPYTNVRNGVPIYDDMTLIYDDENAYYDGDDPMSYTNIAKPTGTPYTNISKPT